MKVTAIRSRQDHRAALKAIDRLLAKGDGISEAQDRVLEALSVLVADYEDRHFPIEDMDPVEYLHHHMENTGRKQADLAAILESRSLASEIVNRRRAMSLEVMRRISAAWNVPIALLTPSYEIERRTA